MEIKSEILPATVIRFSAQENNKEIARASLVLAYNDLHKEPFGLLEDIFVNDDARSQGIGNMLVEHIIDEAKTRKCYKLIATSRFARDRVHQWYERLGLKRYGFEFRMDFKQ